MLQDFVIKQAGNAVNALIEIDGIEKFMEKLKKRGTRPNPKYAKLKEDLKSFYEEQT